MPAMSIDDALSHVVAGRACLFLGAGYSTLFKDVSSRALPLGTELASEMVAQCGGKLTTDLRVAATQMLRGCGNEAYASFLRDRFTVSAVSQDAIQIASEKWSRVYTTNFDDGFEKASIQSKRRYVSAIVTDSVPEYIHSPRVCVHIHGYVDRVAVSTIENDLVLTLPAYASGRFFDSPWHAVLKHDLRAARAVFFVGYSLGDLDVAKTLDQCGIDIADKTFFITKEGGDNDLEILLQDFGSFCPLGLKGFAAKLATMDRTPTSKTYMGFEAFRDLRLAVNPVRPSDSDMYRLLMSGFLNDDLILTPATTPDGATYTVQRQIVDEIASAVAAEKPNVIGIRGNISNGKTLVLYQIAATLLQRGYRALMLVDGSRNWSEEIQRAVASSKDRLLFIVDEFSSRLQCVEDLIRCARKGDVIALADRHGRFDALETKIRQVTGGSLLEYDVDNLAASERSKLVELLHRHGLWGDYAGAASHRKERLIEEDLGNQIRGLLLGVLESPDAIQRLEQSLDDIDFANPEFSGLLVCLVLVITQAAELRQDVVDDLSTGIPLRRMIANSQGARALVQLRSPNMIRTVSSVVAQTIVRNFVPLDSLVRCLTTAVKRSSNLSTPGNHRSFAKTIMQFRVIQQLLPNTETRSLESIEVIYDLIKTESGFSNDPQFWLQYAICQLFLRNFERSEKYFKTAYSVCRPGYDKRYIDNHFARYLLESAVLGPSAPLPIANAEEQLNKAKGLLGPQFSEDVYYPYKVATHILAFVQMYGRELSATTRESTLRFVSQVLKNAENAISRGSAHKYIFQCKHSLERALDVLRKSAVKS
jgi:hypothetical protein